MFLSSLEHLLSKSGGDCTFIHQFIECQSEYRVFFTLILIKSGTEIEKRNNEDLNMFIIAEVHKEPFSDSSEPFQIVSVSVF